MTKKVIFLTGGARSGKSRHALELANQYHKKAFIATAVPFDSGMEKRIKKHQKERGSDFITIEEPVNLTEAVQSLSDTDVAVIDCITVWLGNLMHQFPGHTDELPQINSFLDTIKAPPCSLIIVSNEVGMGIVPENALARDFRDLAGFMNQKIADIADQVFFMVSGYPVSVKE
jgi:adenosylcobinamide kinase/adenosylcobinamide-phosphate guanylyltransferase